jgi:hypothetical protein
MSNRKWEYVRTNSKGEAIFRKNTDESLEFVCDYLSENNIYYEVVLSASLIRIQNQQGREYVYYWTTGRWSPRNPRYKKHYHSNGIADFVKSYLNRFVEQNLQEEKEREKNEIG